MTMTMKVTFKRLGADGRLGQGESITGVNVVSQSHIHKLNNKMIRRFSIIYLGAVIGLMAVMMIANDV